VEVSILRVFGTPWRRSVIDSKWFALFVSMAIQVLCSNLIQEENAGKAEKRQERATSQGMMGVPEQTYVND
jgi:hypothetical protein